MPDLLIRGGSLVLDHEVAQADLAIQEGRIQAIGPALAAGDGDVIDARGLIVLPGLVDGHVHFNEPGRAHWEGWAAGTRGAAAGGVTTVLEMPLNASPPTITAAAFDAKRDAAAAAAVVDFGLWGGLVTDNRDQLEGLCQRGAVALKAFMCDSGIDDYPRVDDDLLADGLARAARLGVPVGVHAESQALTARLGDALRQAGRADRKAWGESRPVAAEVEAVDHAVECLRRAGRGARLHVVHVSSADGLAPVTAGRREGLDLTAETCPHYLAFSEDDFLRSGPPLKCAPPLRAAPSRERLWAALLAGAVDMVQSDHSPCPAADKHRGEHDVWLGWGGITGIQATLPLLLTEGVHRRGMPLDQVARLTARNPARRYGLHPRKGGIVPGADADVVLVDLSREWTFTPDHLQARCGLSGWTGRRFKGAVVRTIVRGRTVYRDGTIRAEPGTGQFLRPRHGAAS